MEEKKVEEKKLEIKRYIVDLMLGFHKVTSAELKQARAEYKGIICSACPFSLGLKHFTAYRVVPCSQFSGVMYRLEEANDCVMIRNGGWTKSRLLEEIIALGGVEAEERFLAKESGLKARN